MRAFLGIPCPTNLARYLDGLFSELTDKINLKPVSPQNYHVTVKFLGEVEEKFCGRLADKVDDVLSLRENFQVKIRYAGVFPNPGNPRVIWAGAGPEEPLKSLNATVEEVAHELGVEKEKREFHPHLTLGRIKRGLEDPRPVINWLKEHGNNEFGTIKSPSLVLYESKLKPEGPQYRELNQWKI